MATINFLCVFTVTKLGREAAKDQLAESARRDYTNCALGDGRCNTHTPQHTAHMGTWEKNLGI